MRKIDLLIRQSRTTTENTDVSENSGIQDEEFIGYANDAQMELQSAISNLYSDVFQDEEIIQCVPMQEAYNIPDDAFLGNRLELVEFSYSGTGTDYYQVKQGRLSERLNSDVSGAPSYYIRRSGKILLQPAPNSAASKIRVTYQKSLPSIDKVRATIGSVVLDNTARTITSLVLDTTKDIDETSLEEEGYISICDKDGLVKMRRIPVSDVDTATGIVTVYPGFVFESGETIAAGDFALRGKESTTHSKLSDICERYLVSYMNWKILKRDSSNDSREQTEELLKMLTVIVETYKTTDTDVDLIPIIDSQYLGADYDYYSKG